MLAFIIPTRDRPEELAATLHAVGRLRLGERDGEVVVVDNASRVTPTTPARLANGVRVRLMRRGSNEGAASRTSGALEVEASRKWLVMLDDDSAPVERAGGPSLLELLADRPTDVGAVTADIRLPARGGREAGGLPEVPVGCGVAYRREAYLHAGGYDPVFNYYVEEYDLAAKLLLAGWRVEFEPRFRVEHRKVEAGRDMDLILERLVRNNGWVMARYAPAPVRGAMLGEVIERYRGIAEKEHALAGYTRGLVTLQRTLHDQPREAMSPALWDRFTGLSAAREAVGAFLAKCPFETAAIVEAGKNDWCVRRALEERGISITDGDRADVLAIGTMSPGPMLDAAEGLSGSPRRVLTPWVAAWGVMTPEIGVPGVRGENGAKTGAA
jgi:GT2 family glycosyltransferase